MLKILFHTVYYQFTIFARIKTALFFSWIFPIFLFVIFGNLWGANSSYIPFLLTGVLGMNITSEGLYAVGPVIKEYYSNGLIKYLKKLPFNIIIYFVGYVFSRVISQIGMTIILFAVAYIAFDFLVTPILAIQIFMGVLSGLLIFSFVGLVISFSGVRQLNGPGAVSIIGYTIIFTSNTFYPVKDFNKTISAIGDFFPLNSLLALMRGQDPNLLNLTLWLVIPLIIFFILFTRLRFNR